VVGHMMHDVLTPWGHDMAYESRLFADVCEHCGNIYSYLSMCGYVILGMTKMSRPLKGVVCNILPH
jgi:hypothetical protein